VRNWETGIIYLLRFTQIQKLVAVNRRHNEGITIRSVWVFCGACGATDCGRLCRVKSDRILAIEGKHITSLRHSLSAQDDSEDNSMVGCPAPARPTPRRVPTNSLPRCCVAYKSLSTFAASSFTCSRDRSNSTRSVWFNCSSITFTIPFAPNTTGTPTKYPPALYSRSQ